MTDQKQAGLVDTLQTYLQFDENRSGDSAVEHMVCVNHPALQAAEARAASLYGAGMTRFLSNGSTQGIHGLMMTACRAKDKILIPRNAHRSVLGGFVLSGADPVFVTPRYDPERGLLRQVLPEDVEAALVVHPDCRAVLVVSPNYQGVAADLSSLATICHQHKIPLLVDEAHGPHFGFHPALPPSALACGADGTVQSTHKLLGALTQSSMVHIQGGLLDPERFCDVLDLLRPQESSLMLLASLDGARRQMALEGEQLLEKANSLARYARDQINRLPGLTCFSAEEAADLGGAAFDCTKLTVQVSRLGITGPEAESCLRKEWQVQSEYADLHNVLFLITIGDTEDTVERLLEGLTALCEKPLRNRSSSETLPVPEGVWEPAIGIREALYGAARFIPLADSVGCISQGVLCPYPPGIPVVYPGERLTPAGVEYLMHVARSGIPIMGIQYIKGDHLVAVVRREDQLWIRTD